MAHITNAKAIQHKSRSHTIAQTGDTTFTVTSGTSGNVYTITLLPDTGATCTCEWSKYRPRNDNRSGCSHVVSVYNYLAGQAGRRVMAWTDEAQAKKQHRPTLAIGDGITLTMRVAK